MISAPFSPLDNIFGMPNTISLTFHFFFSKNCIMQSSLKHLDYFDDKLRIEKFE